MQLDIPQVEGSDLVGLDVIEVVVPPEANTENYVWYMLMSDRLQQSAIDEGYVTVHVTATSQLGGDVTFLDAPIQIHLPALPLDGVVAFSGDGIVWTKIPRIAVRFLPIDSQDGYFVEIDGTVTIFTRHLASFGIRKPQASLELSVAEVDIVSGSVSRALAAGGASEDPIRYKTLSSLDVCTVTDSGLIYGVSAGICTVFATQGGGSMYLDTSSVTFNTKVVGAIVPLVPPVQRLPLVVQLAALIVLTVLLGLLGNQMWRRYLEYKSKISQN